jgi:hypothetical protein
MSATFSEPLVSAVDHPIINNCVILRIIDDVIRNVSSRITLGAAVRTIGRH